MTPSASFPRDASRRAFLRTLGCGRSGAPPAAIAPRRRSRERAPVRGDRPRERAGSRFVHENAMSPERYLPETMGPGVRLPRLRQRRLDGRLHREQRSLRLLHPEGAAAQRALPQQPRRHLHGRDREGGSGRRHLRAWAWPSATTTTTAIPTCSSPPTGAASCTATTATGPSPTSRTRPGSAAPGWTTSAVWFDYDNDGRLDLFVCSFVEFGAAKNVVCGDNKLGRRYYCIPRVFKPTASLLFHNNGDGTFTEVSKGTDIARALGKALGVVATDVNNDGLLDLFVANDTVPELPVHEPRQGQVGRDRPGLRGGLQRERPAALRHGGRCRGRRRRRLAGPLRGQRRQRDVLALPQQRATSPSATSRTRPRHRPGHAPPLAAGASSSSTSTTTATWTSSWPTAIPTTWWTATAAR